MAKNCKPSIIIPDKYSVVVVQNIAERNDISCKLRQNGTIAVVVEEGYAQYQIQTQGGLYSVCNNNAWVQIKTGDKHYVHDQFSPSSLWVIEHNLNKKASVSVVDTAGNLVDGAVKYINDNKLTIEFNYPFSGYAYLN